VKSKKTIYPIKCKLVPDGNPEQEIPVDVIQVSHSGFMVDSLNTPLVVNKVYQVRIKFPFTENLVDVTVVVFRTFAQIAEPNAARKMKLLCELVYKKPNRTFNEMLIKFLANVSHRTKV
jgi:hypothetical protein